MKDGKLENISLEVIAKRILKNLKSKKQYISIDIYKYKNIYCLL